MLKLLSSAAIALSLSSAVAQQAPTHAPDGGTRQRIESVMIPTTTNAPFTSIVVTEWTRILPDGSTATNKNHRTVARDSSGRVFQERRYLTPNGDTVQTALSELDYQDPNRHEWYICHPVQKTCELYPFTPSPSVTLPPQGELPGGYGSIKREDLGRKTIENLEALGSREVTTINTGAIGNQKPEPVVKEFWFSPHLGVNIITKRFDPRASAVQNFEFTKINLTEPNPSLFEPPADFRIIKMDAQ